MKDQEIIDNAPVWADTHRKLLDYPDLTTYTDNGRDDKLDRSLADIKRIVELEKGIEKLSIAVSEAFPSLLSCDNVLIVPVPAYNKIVEEFNALKEPKT
jgi:hypothetical protein